MVAIWTTSSLLNVPLHPGRDHLCVVKKGEVCPRVKEGEVCPPVMRCLYNRDHPKASST